MVDISNAIQQVVNSDKECILALLAIFHGIRISCYYFKSVVKVLENIKINIFLQGAC